MVTSTVVDFPLHLVIYEFALCLATSIFCELTLHLMTAMLCEFALYLVTSALRFRAVDCISDVSRVPIASGDFEAQ